MVIEFPAKRTSVPMRCEYMPPHRTLCSLFDPESPLMDFLKDLYQQHRILTVHDWDSFGGPYLFEKFNLDDASRREFRDAVGSPYRPLAKAGAHVLVLRPQQ